MQIYSIFKLKKEVETRFFLYFIQSESQMSNVRKIPLKYAIVKISDIWFSYNIDGLFRIN